MTAFMVFAYMFIGCAVVCAYADQLADVVMKDIDAEPKVEMSRTSIGLNMAVFAVIWPALFLLGIPKR